MYIINDLETGTQTSIYSNRPLL